MNDLFPEEQDPEFEELITLLRHADLNPPLIDPTEHEKIISQARARLFPTDHKFSQPEHTPVLEMQELRSLPSKPKARIGKRGRFVRLLNVIAAVLVIAALIGTSFLIFGPLSSSKRDRLGATPSIGPAIGPVGAPVKVRDVTLDGFERVFKITPGPYFLGELLEVDLSITNHTHTDYWLFPEDGTLFCGLLRVSTSGGGSPHAPDVQRSWNGLPDMLKCNWPWTSTTHSSVQLQVNHTTTIKHYIQITSSGYIDLQVEDNLRRSTSPDVRKSAPDTGTVIFQKLFVSSLVPSDRQLSVKVHGMQLDFADQPAVRGQIIGEWKAVCTEGGSNVVGPGSISAPIVDVMPLCISKGSPPSTRLWRAYVVGAPGYALVSGKMNG